LLAYRVVMQVAQTSQPRELVGRHGSGETENVSDQLAVGVLALRFHDHLDTGQSKVLLADDQGDLVGDIPSHVGQLEAVGRGPVERLGDVRGRHLEQGRQTLYHGRSLAERQVRGTCLDREGRHVLHQLAARSIEDETPRCPYRLESDPVLSRQPGVVAATHDLEGEEAQSEGRYDEGDDQREDGEARPQSKGGRPLGHRGPVRPLTVELHDRPSKRWSRPTT